MKNTFFILIGVIFITAYACSKVSTGTNSAANTSGTDTTAKKDTTKQVSKDTTTNKDTTTKVFKDTAAFYNILSVFMKQGTTWDCYRYDTLERTGALMFGARYGSYSGNWQKNLIGDSIKSNPSLASYDVIYRDSTVETFTVNGRISLAELKKYFPWSASFLSITYLAGQYPTTNVLGFQIYDTSMLSILTIKNKTRNTIDTEFVFLSKSYFAIIPQITTITAYGSTAAYTTRDYSLPFVSCILSSLNVGSDSFYFLNKLYSSDLTFSHKTIFYGSPGFRPVGSDSTSFNFSGTKGFFKQYFAQGNSELYIGYTSDKVCRINVAN